MEKFVYYMTMRPFGIGCQPKRGLVDAESYDEKTFVDEIGRKVWSRIVYDRELTEQEVSQYELVPAEPKLYYGYAHYADGTVMCHCVGTSEQLDESERRIRSRASARFTRKEAEREFVLAHA